VDRAYTAVHIEEDRRHWYFRGRLAVLLGVLERVVPPPPCRLLELGCGTGNVLQALGRFGEAVGVERDRSFARWGAPPVSTSAVACCRTTCRCPMPGRTSCCCST
jgi:SAM-dependent methyltransferase